MVDWEPLAASTFYLGPMRNTRRVGKTAAEFIDFLVSETGVRTEQIHFLGTELPFPQNSARKQSQARVAGGTRFQSNSRLPKDTRQAPT